MSMITLQIFSSIQERDVDMLLVEELNANEEFASWLVARTWGISKFSSHVRTWHSVSVGVLGESDVVFLFADAEANHRALLIENKIDAAAQPNQAERYRKRGEQGKTAGDWVEYRTCLVAPDRYFDSERHSGTYDYDISYEELLAFFASRAARDRRYGHKAMLLNEAIVQNRRGRLSEINAPVTKYFRDYYSAASVRVPALGVQKPGERAAGNTWMYFKPTGYPPDVQLVHQASGSVKLFFDAQVDSLEDIRLRMAAALGSGAKPEAAGKSVSVTISVPPLAPQSGDFEKDRQAAEEAFSALVSLDAAYRASYSLLPLK